MPAAFSSSIGLLPTRFLLAWPCGVRQALRKLPISCGLLISNASKACICCNKRSATLSTTIRLFSAMHGRLWSNEAPATISCAALTNSAVSSTRQGGLPAPAPITFLPLFMAIATMAGPPVIASKAILSWAIICWVASKLGSFTVTTRLRMPQLLKMMASIWAMRSSDTALAPGWGLK
ncbi:Uncharacterised protein [Yersinia enterocolitica]|nr:Uncharacterised protein [Yersinia enterocolitica]